VLLATHPPGGWTQAIEAADVQTQTIIIACTSENIPVTALEQYGISDHLQKPISTLALRHMLHKWMPRNHSPKSLLPPPASIQRSTSGTFAGRVLMVEDCEVTLSAVRLLMQQQGLCIETASSGSKAMAALTRHDYDLIIVDVNLPDISGYAIASWYRELCRTDNRRKSMIVAVTADPDVEACKEFGIDQCLPKPLSTLRIINLLQDLWTHHTKASTAAAAAAGWETQQRPALAQTSPTAESLAQPAPIGFSLPGTHFGGPTAMKHQSPVLPAAHGGSAAAEEPLLAMRLPCQVQPGAQEPCQPTRPLSQARPPPSAPSDVPPMPPQFEAALPQDTSLSAMSIT